ncbi:DCC1-like thiol-disulfide oxidoreductase family protein [Dyadobacter sp. BHUBP1]|uniref:DCC1-like thiol-disulfide oxidoreductase family protein n=1 Tax=Dyadobacter sp. BHUBP1 TaxID=3424178 RepID=UPI003D325B87
MKTLHSYTILYDAECPMCDLYTGAFVRNGLLDAHGREAYQEYAGAACPNLDWQRAVNEIALVNQATGEVTYGIESLLKVCGNAIPLLAPLFRWKPFLWIASKAYAFISYNRRVIIPAAASKNKFGYQPSFNAKYRIAWIILGWVVTSLVMATYPSLLGGTITSEMFVGEFAICAGHILLQCLMLMLGKKSKIWDYLGNLTTISLAGALVFFLTTLTCMLLNLSWQIAGISGLIIIALMIREHVRRSRLLGIGYWPTITWILYRVIIVIVLINLLT